MKVLIGAIILLTAMSTHLIFDFNTTADISGWTIIDDVVMGGKSMGTFKLSPEGFGLFEGQISLENNGGFSSIRYQFGRMDLSGATKIMVKLKGDGKRYRLRIKNNSNNHYSYIASFSTSGEWQQIEIPLKEMFPSFRGRRLDQPNFAHHSIEEIAFVIGNNKAEEFKLLIDKIELN